MSSTTEYTHAGPYTTGTTAPAKKTKKCCRCPACEGLECLERPRYFAGQLLTEAELNSEQAYMLAKNRLHNRYLHGWGVVCGLAVVCSNCEGWVRIKEGYAIDPCGNDIIVCKDIDFNLIDAIHKCIEARKRPVDECAPWQDPNADCSDEEQWCVTISYRENEAKPTMPLRQDSSGCDCGCGGGCGGGCDCGGGCGCGGSKKSSKSKSTTYGCKTCQPVKPAKPSRPPACEPTRVLESFCIGIVPQPESCREAHVVKSGNGQGSSIVSTNLFANSAITNAFKPGTGGEFLSALLPPAITSSKWFRLVVAARPEDTLLDDILGVWEQVRDFVAENMSKADNAQISTLIESVLTGKPGGSSIVNQPANPPNGDLCCRFRRVVQLLYTTNPLNVRCNGFDCPPCQKQQTPPTDGEHSFPFTTGPQTTTVDPLLCLIYALIDYVIDAICLLLLPPCPASQCDDRLILACVTVKNDKIVHICNFDCRHYAGSFNSLAYWLSAFPIVELIAKYVRELCCTPDIASSIAKTFNTDTVDNG